MPETTVYEGRIRHLQILDEHGRFDEQLGAGVLSDDRARELYRTMVLSRIFDETAVSLQREGRMGTYAECAGQEAAAVGSAAALSAADWMFPCYREVGAYLLRGIPPEQIFLFWMGDERANAIPAAVNNFPLCIPVATQTLHATGAAWTQKIKRTGAASLVYFGDGATSKGDFHEAMNFAGVFKLPVIFFCSNNSWAISVPRERQTASKTLAQKAIAYGVEGVSVDGNDLFAVVRATTEAVGRARRGEGATFIEAVTYRLSNHTTADDATRYREAAEVELWRTRDPIVRMRNWLMARGLLNEAEEDALREEGRAFVAEAVKRAEGIAPPQRADIFRHVFAGMPTHLREQMEVGSVPTPESEGAAVAYGGPRVPPPNAPGEYLPPEPAEGADQHPASRLRSRSRAGKGA